MKFRRFTRSQKLICKLSNFNQTFVEKRQLLIDPIELRILSTFLDEKITEMWPNKSESVYFLIRLLETQT